jgi:hypothetical protein
VRNYDSCPFHHSAVPKPAPESPGPARAAHADPAEWPAVGDGRCGTRAVLELDPADTQARHNTEVLPWSTGRSIEELTDPFTPGDRRDTPTTKTVRTDPLTGGPHDTTTDSVASPTLPAESVARAWTVNVPVAASAYDHVAKPSPLVAAWNTSAALVNPVPSQ